MIDRLSNGTWQANETRSRSLVSVDETRESAGTRSMAAHKDAMQLMDAASQTSVGPAGVVERRVGFQPADQTPAGGGGKSGAQVTLRIRSVVGMTFSPKGSLVRDQTAESNAI